jgi:heme exporter protein A
MTFADYRLEADGLGCRRGMAAIFDGVTFTLGSGEALVVRGPNGSGKSSLLRLLCGLMNRAAGAVRLSLGGTPVEEPERLCHFIGHQPAVTDALSVRANLAFQTALLGGERSRVAALIERVALLPLADAPGRHLSAGQKRRLALARLIAVPRPLWLLDEPGTSLDAAGEALLAELARAHRGAGGLIVLATHGVAPFPASAELLLTPAHAP